MDPQACTAETPTVLMVDYAESAAGEDVPVLVGVARQAWLELPASVGAQTCPFVDFEARLDPVTRSAVVLRNEIRRPSSGSR